MFEPDPIRWFPSWSAGKLLILLWSIMGMFLNFGFNCNLRAVIIAKDYESPVNSLQDVLDRGQTPYLPIEVPFIWPSRVGESVFLDEKWKAITEMTFMKGGNYSLTQSGGEVPDWAYKDIMDNGASYFTHSK